MVTGSSKIAGDDAIVGSAAVLQDDGQFHADGLPATDGSQYGEAPRKPFADACSGPGIISSLWKLYDKEVKGDAVANDEEYRAIKDCGEMGVDSVLDRYRAGGLTDDQFLAFIRPFEEYAGAAAPEVLSLLEKDFPHKLSAVMTIGNMYQAGAPYAGRLLKFARSVNVRDKEMLAELLVAFAKMGATSDDVIAFMRNALKTMTASDMPEILRHMMPGERRYYPLLIYVVDYIDMDKTSRATELLEMMDLQPKDIIKVISDIQFNTLIAMPDIVRRIYQSDKAALDVIIGLIRKDPDGSIRIKALNCLLSLLSMSDISPDSVGRGEHPKVWKDIVFMLNGILMTESSPRIKEGAVWCLFHLKRNAKDSLPYLYDIFYKEKDQNLSFAARRAIQNITEDIM